MPVKKAKKTTGKASIKKIKITKKVIAAKKSAFASFIEYLRLGESYSSLVLGVIAVIIATILLLSLIHGNKSSEQTPDATPTMAQSTTFAISATPSSTTVTSTVTPVPTKTSEKTYTVAVGDDLWKIAEKFYNSGYNWVDIAKANNLSNPSDIHVGNKLAIPAVTPKVATVVKIVHTADDYLSTSVSTHVKITGNTYTIAHGDDLWDIAVRAYGDGYQWVKIAKANNLTNPNLVHVGNVLKIPRD